MSYYADKPEQIASLLEIVRDKGKRSIIAVSGPPLSGKTTLSHALIDIFGDLSMLRDGRPSFLEIGEFVSPKVKNFQDKTGFGLYHPGAYDVNGLRKFLNSLVRGDVVGRTVRTLEGGQIVERKVKYFVPEGGVIVVDGLYSCRFLSDVTDICVYVDVAQRLELIMRRLFKMVYGLSSEDTIRLAALADVMWHLFGEDQRKRADVLYLNNYHILEELGTTSYQFKVCEGDFREALPEIFEKLVSSDPLYVEDYIVSEGSERLRARLCYGDGGPSSLEVSYRYYVPENLPYLRVAKHSLNSHILPALLVSLGSMGFRLRVVERKIRTYEQGNVKFKHYHDRKVVELEASSLEALRPYLDLFKGRIRLRSYYTGTDMCPEG